MKLTELQLEIMDRVRDKVLSDEQTFICLAIESVVGEMVVEQAEKLRFKAFLGVRRDLIRNKMLIECNLLTKAIGASIYPHVTFTNWLSEQLEGLGVKWEGARGRLGRVAWLDRIIDTREIA